MSKQFTKVLLFVSLVITLSACGGNSGFDIVIKENIEVEYGEELDHTILYDVEKSEKDLTVKEVKDFDSMKIGEQEITVVFAIGEDTQEEKVKVNVKDTKAPEIVFKSEKVEITLGDEINTATNIESVKDPVDGDIKKSDDNTITKDGYFITADIKSEVGEYTVTVTAFDKNGNKTEKSYQLVIKEKDQATENQPVASNQGGMQSQAPSQSNQSSSGSSSSSSQPAPSQPKTVCPNGNEPDNPNLPCETFIAGDLENAYKDASGNIMAFPTAEAAWDWAYDVMSNDKSFDIYSRFATVPLWRNDQTSWDGVVFFK